MNCFKSFLCIVAASSLCIFFEACSKTDADGNDSGIISELMSHKWISRDTWYGEGDDNHAWFDVETVTLYFTSESKGIAYWVTKDYDTHLGNSKTTDYVLFDYWVSGNQVTIVDNTTSIYYLSDGYLVSETGSFIYEPYSMSSGDYERIKDLGPKEGSVGSDLSYTYDDKTKELTIRGIGQMNDYYKGSQPWASYNIKKVTIEEGCTYVGANAFYGIQSIEEVDLPNSLKEIGEYAFCDLFIDELYVPTGLVKIGNYAFSDCKYLKKVNFAGCDLLEEIGDYAFAFCPISFSYFELMKNVKNVGIMAFASSTFSGSLELNDKVETIGDGAFASISGRAKIQKLVIPNTTKSIGSKAFSGNIGEIRIGSGLQLLGDCPFIGNSYGSMYVNFSRPISLDNATYNYIICNIDGNVTPNWTLYVPKGCKSAFLNAEGWKKFKTIIEDPSLINGNGDGDSQNNGTYAGTIQGHDYVDLGLSVKWATCNIGADDPEDFGDYYRWGATSSAYIPDYYTWSKAEGSYEFYDEETSTYKDIGSNISGTKYDAAYKNWGNKWRMPTVEEWKELKSNCSWTWISRNGVNGLLITAKNNQTLFLPAAGGLTGVFSDDYCDEGDYWTSNIDSRSIEKAEIIRFSSGSFNTPNWQTSMRFWGFSIRPVTE